MSKTTNFTKFSNALKNIFTPTRKSAAASQPHTEEGRRVNLSETRPKNRLKKFFSWFKALFKRKDKDIVSRTATANLNSTNIRDSDTPAPVMSRSKSMLTKLVPIIALAKPYQGLNVTQDYIQEFANNNISFTDLDGKTETGDTLGLMPDQEASYSDHLTEFCGGDKGQALRLSAVLTRDSLDIISPVITGRQDCEWIESSFDVSKIEYDRIKVEIKGILSDQQDNETTVQDITIVVPSENAPYRLGVETT